MPSAGVIPSAQSHLWQPQLRLKNTKNTKKYKKTTEKYCIILENVRQPIAVSDISVYICLIDIRDGSCKPVYGGVDRLKALSSAKTGCRSRFFMN